MREQHSDDFLKPVGKSRSRKYPQGFKKNPAIYNMDNILNFKQQRMHAHSVFV